MVPHNDPVGCLVYKRIPATKSSMRIGSGNETGMKQEFPKLMFNKNVLYDFLCNAYLSAPVNSILNSMELKSLASFPHLVSYSLKIDDQIID